MHSVSIFLIHFILKSTGSQSKMKTICFQSRGNYGRRLLQIRLEGETKVSSLKHLDSETGLWHPKNTFEEVSPHICTRTFYQSTRHCSLNK